uniref:Uncharacterized protein n=1 Tax=Megaselia scalaris TaxID=36166 RepID=T1GK06_MEGSC
MGGGPENSMRLGSFGKIAISWGVLTGVGIYSFILSKNSIDKQRLESLRVRDRMRKSNYGDYQVEEDRKFQI